MSFVSEETSLIYGLINGIFAVGFLVVGGLHLRRNDAAAGRIVAVLGLSLVLRSVWYFLIGFSGSRMRLLNRFAMLVQFLGMSFVAAWFAAIRRELYCRRDRGVSPPSQRRRRRRRRGDATPLEEDEDAAAAALDHDNHQEEESSDASEASERRSSSRFAVAFVVVNVLLWLFTLATSMVENNVTYELNLLAIVLCFLIVSVGLLAVSKRLTVQVYLFEEHAARFVDDDAEARELRAARRQVFRFKVITASFLITLFFLVRVGAILAHVSGRRRFTKHDKGIGTTHSERVFLFPWFYYTIPELFADVVLLFLTAPNDSLCNVDDIIIHPLVTWYNNKAPSCVPVACVPTDYRHLPPPPKAAQDCDAIKQRLGLDPERRTDYDIA